MRNWGTLVLFALCIGVALATPFAASARPAFRAPFAPGPLPFAPADQGVLTTGPRLIVTGLGSAPVTAAPGHAYLLRGTVANSGPKAVHGALTVHLLRVGMRPISIGAAPVTLRGRHAGRYAVRVAIPAGLRKGSYALVACTMRRGASGPLGCATAERHLQVGKPAQLRVTAARADAACSSGAHTLSSAGDRVYPELGNGGYTSVHSDVYLAYDPASNLFLPGTHVDLTDQANQCLTDFSLDFERSSVNTTAGPSMTVSSVTVNGQPATFAFVQPTYPGDPNGPNDPDPNAHQASQLNPVGGPNANPLPPACSPEIPERTSTSSLNGTACPANKLVITPSSPIPSGSSFVVSVSYTGRPGVHNDGDATTEGWFRSNSPAGDGAFVTTEPAGTEDWMPLNDHPSAKPTYDFYDTIPIGKTGIANGELVTTTTNPPDVNFPAGSATWHWHSPEGIASYLVENSIGSFDLTQRLAASGIQYYEAQGSSITTTKKASNKAIMDQQEDIVNFQSMFNGAFPFSTDGVVIGVPSASFEEEMQTKITFAGGTISLGTFNHENMHQWWGDNVSESNFNLTFYKEGMATLGEYLNTARTAATNAGGLGTPAGDAAFETSLVNRFNATSNYGNTGSLWTAAPSNPTAATLFTTATTYTRPGTAYLALREILGPANFYAAMQHIQADHRQGTITEPQLESAFKQFLPNPSSGCQIGLDTFFKQWFDTVYPTGGGANRPQQTGPGLAGPGFNCAPTVTASFDPPSPGGLNGWYIGPVTVHWSTDDPNATKNCVDQTVSADGLTRLSCNATNSGGTSDLVSVQVKVDQTNPTSSATISPAIRNGWYASPTVTLTGNDGSGSGIDHIDYAIDGGQFHVYSAPLSGFSTGNHFVQYRATDVAGRVESTTNLIAFKADAMKPSVTITAPDDGAVIPLDKATTAKYKCVDRESGLDTCVGTVPNGAPLDTSTVGPHTFTVTATDLAGNTTTSTVHYQVVYRWTGFYSPITNTDSGVNLVHAGDLIKLGFGLDGDRGSNIFADGYPTSEAIPCPAGTPHSVPAAGAGSAPGLDFGVASGHYIYGWQTQAAWAGTCRRFEIVLNDGSGTVHSADFLFFS